MEARTTPFTRMSGLSLAYRADRDMLAALEQGGASADRVLDRILRAIGHGPARTSTCCRAVTSEATLGS